MKTYTLKTTVNGHASTQKLTAAQTVKIQAQAGAKYELIDETGKVLQPVSEQGSLKWLQADGEDIILWVENYGEQALMPVSSGSHVAAPVAETALVQPAAVTAAEVGVSKAVLWGVGGL
ncbi:MAG: hypothetical protein Q4E77_09065, partial [Conchiformibius sp.]|nr:hypothetical protein [Conchiformibius sp.]